MARKPLIFIIALILAVLAGLLLRSIFFRPTKAPTPPVSGPSEQAPQNQATSSPSAQTQPQTPPKAPAPSAPALPPAVSGQTEIMAWIYPGDPTCTAPQEYATKKIDILKPEYFKVEGGGALTLLTDQYGCNGYSPQNVADIKKHSKQQYVTVSSSDAASMDAFLNNSLQDGTNINTLTNFVVSNSLTGIEIDFEDFGGWTGDMYAKYKQFIGSLGDTLHKNGKKLMIDGPATSNQTEENWFVWRYGDFAPLPVDKIVVMAYDYQYDQGVGEPISPIAWIQNTIKWTLGEYPYKSKLTIGIPSYGYKGKMGTQKFTILTYNQIKREPGFANAVLDGNSYEMTWRDGNYVYFYQNSYSLSKKLQAIQSAGINSVSVWHLGGNLWFSQN